MYKIIFIDNRKNPWKQTGWKPKTNLNTGLEQTISWYKDNLKIIGRAGAGVDNIDLEAANKKNVIVMNTPGGNTNATAEHTLSLLLSPVP